MGRIQKGGCEISVISQKDVFELYEKNSSRTLIEIYENILCKYSGLDCVRILDIGGAGGRFAALLHEYFRGNCDITVLDIEEYETLGKISAPIRFIKGSVFDVKQYFKPRSFDIVFSNYVFHHLMDNSYHETIGGIKLALEKIKECLAPGGILCVSECFYHNLLAGDVSGFIIYRLSRLKSPFTVRLLNKLGSNSAGAGVCFLPERKWRKVFEQAGYRLERTTAKQIRFIKKLAMKEMNYYFVLKVYHEPY